MLVAAPASAAPRSDIAPVSAAVQAPVQVAPGVLRFAQAAPADCPNNMFCFWTYRNHEGSMHAFPRYWSGPLTGEVAFLNNNAESVVNNTSNEILMYDGQTIGVGAWSYVGARVRSTSIGSWRNRPSALVNR